MISVNDAFEKIDRTVKKLEVINLEVEQAVGFVMAEDCISPIAFPPFHQSAMDGYAVNGTAKQLDFIVVDELKAGDSATSVSLKIGEACRVFTGSMLPDQTVAVVKQEEVSRIKDSIQITRSISNQENIRLRGEQINSGEVAVSKGTVLNPGAIGFLSTLGIESVKVYRKPKIAVIATGNELVESGAELEPGQIFESNTNTLIAALQVYNFKASSLVVKDEYDLIKEQIAQAIEANDLVIITGGISVGDYDYVGNILSDLQVEEKFYKVKQKPGKPLFFGVKEETLIFALPGNPAAVLTSFYMYVLRALADLTGRKSPFLMHHKAHMSAEFKKSQALTLFLKGKVEEGQVVVLPAQSSAMLSSFIESNCLIRLDEKKSSWAKGEMVDVYMI